MARTASDFKHCKYCKRIDKFAWWNSGTGWKLVKAATDNTGAVIRRTVQRTIQGKMITVQEPIPETPIKLHVCGSADGFSPRTADEDTTFNPNDFAPFVDVLGKDEGSLKEETDDLEAKLKASLDSLKTKKEETYSKPMNQTPTAQPTSADPLAIAIASAIKPLLKDSLDSGEIRNMIQSEIKKIRDEVIRVEDILIIKDSNGDTTKTFESSHPNLPRLIRTLNTRKPDGGRFNAYLFGPPGSSKTTSARQAAEALNLAYSYISLNPQTADSRVAGFIDANGTYRDTAFYKAYTEGGLFCIDEIDNASDNLLTALNSAIDNGHAAFPCGQVLRHKDFALVATANTAGRGGNLNHAGRRPLDAATLERFVFFEWLYDEVLETKMTLAAWDGSQPWLNWIRKVRVYATEHYPRLVVSPRASMSGAALLKSGAFSNVETLADAILFKGLDKESRDKILRACPLPTIKEQE